MFWRSMKLLFCLVLLLVTCSCGARYFAEETRVELYNPQGQLIGKIFSNKGYDDFACKVKMDKDEKVKELEWTAKKVNSDTVANTALQAVKEQAGVIKGLVGGAGAFVSP